MVNEIHPAVEAGNVQKRHADLNRRFRKKATRALLVRLVIALFLIAALWTCLAFGLMALQLVIPLEAVVMIWLAVWFGAWLQLMFAREGLLK